MPNPDFEDIPLTSEVPTVVPPVGGEGFEDIPLTEELIPGVAEAAPVEEDDQAKSARLSAERLAARPAIGKQWDAEVSAAGGTAGWVTKQSTAAANKERGIPEDAVETEPGKWEWNAGGEGPGGVDAEGNPTGPQVFYDKEKYKGPEMPQEALGNRLVRGALRGTLEATKNGAAAAGALSGAVLPGMTADEGAAVVREAFGDFGKPGSVAEGLAQTAAQFTVGMIGAGKLLKATQVLQGAGKVVTTTRLATQSSIADATVFDPLEGRLSNLIEEHTSLGTPITEYLAAKPDDTEAEGRFKNALEGLMVGGAIDGLLKSLRVIKQVRHVKETKGVPAAVDEFNRLTTELETKSAPVVEVAPEANPSLISPEARDRIVSRLKTEQVIAEARGKDFNFSKMIGDGDEINTADIHAAIDEVSTVFAKEIDEAKGGIVSLKESEELGDMLGMDPNTLMANIAQDAKTVAQQHGRLLAGKALLQDLASQISKEAKAVNNGVTDSKKLDGLLTVMKELHVNLKTVQTGAARTTSAGRVKVKMSDPYILKALELTDGDVKGVMGLMDSPMKRAMNAYNELFINFILSGPHTHAKNILASTLNTVLRSSEKVIGGTISGNLRGAREGLGEFVGMQKALGESWAMMRKALNSEESVLDVRNTKLEHGPKAISAQAFGLNPDSFMGKFINFAGKTVRMSTRTLVAEDEFFKQINYRANLWSRATQEAADKGLKSSDEIAEYIHRRFNESFDPVTGAAKDAEALRHARISTFTEPLRPGSFLADFSHLANKHPGVKMIVPFIKTPANLLKQNFQRTPLLQNTMKSFREDITSTVPGRAAEAHGKMVTAGALYASATFMALNGMLVGSGPTDPEERKVWLQSNTPYTAKIGGKVVPLSALDPYGIPFAMAADFAQARKYMSEEDAEEVATAMVAAVAANLTNKTYMKGLADAIDAIQQPQDKMAYWIQQRVASSVVPSYVNQIRKSNDPTMREVQSIMDAVFNRTPGLSSSLPPRRNFLGKPIKMDDGGPLGAINPFVFDERTAGPVVEELISLKMGLSLPPEKVNEGRIDLHQFKTKTGQDAWDRLCELRTVKINNKNTLEEDLEKLIASERYQKLPRVDDVYTGPRAMVIREMVGKHSFAAYSQLLKEIPELQEAIKADLEAQKMQMRGKAGPSALDPLLSR